LKKANKKGHDIELRGQALYDQGIVHALRKPVGLDIRRSGVPGAYSLWLKTGI